MQSTQLKETSIKGATLKIPTGFCYQIKRRFPLKESDLPKELIIVDPDDGKKYPAALIEVLHLNQNIPSILCLLSEGKYPTDETIKDIFERTETTRIDQLSFYLYESRS